MWLQRHIIGPPMVLSLLILLTHSLAAGGECPNVQYGGGVTIGGPDVDNPHEIATDSAANRFIAGKFTDTVDFDPTEGIDLQSADGGCDPFVTKFNADGTYAWTRTFRGPSCDVARSLAVDLDNNVVVTGYFWETVDFDPGEGVDEHSTNGERDVFVTKLFADGSYAWTRTFGGKGGEEAWDVAVDQEGNIVATGYFTEVVDFDPTEEGEDEHWSAGATDVFVAKFTGDGDFVWAKTFGGAEDDFSRGIALDSGGSVFVTGHFVGTADFDPSDDGEDEYTSNGEDDIFVTKLGIDGSYEWAKTIGGLEADIGDALEVDSAGDVIVIGYFRSTDPVDFDPSEGVDERSSNGSADIFATKLTAEGDYKWTWVAGGSEFDFSDDVELDASGSIYIAGRFGNPGTPAGYTLDFDEKGESDAHISNGGGDAFITQLSADSGYGWTRTFGGPNEDVPTSLAIDEVGNLYIAGRFSGSADLDPTEGVDTHESNGSTDIFVTTLLCTDELPCDGDANGDGLVDPLDSGFVLARFGCEVGAGDPSCDTADMNGDGLVDPLDVGYVLARFGPCQ